MHAATATDFDPVAEKLLEDGRERRFDSLVGRERVTRWLFAAGFLAIAVPLAILVPSARSPSPVIFALLVVAFAIASRIEVEVGSGSTRPTELVLIPMLFLLPVATVPIAVAGAALLGQLPEY